MHETHCFAACPQANVREVQEAAAQASEATQAQLEAVSGAQAGMGEQLQQALDLVHMQAKCVGAGRGSDGNNGL